MILYLRRLEKIEVPGDYHTQFVRILCNIDSHVHNQLPIPGQLEQHLPGGGGSGLGQGGRRHNTTRQSSV